LGNLRIFQSVLNKLRSNASKVVPEVAVAFPTVVLVDEVNIEGST